MRGITETTRGETLRDDRPWSHIVKRCAAPVDLADAQKKFTGKLVVLHHKRYRCLDVRLDTTQRLIFDLVAEQQEQSHAAN